MQNNISKFFYIHFFFRFYEGDVFCLQTQHERSENSQLRAENEKLRTDNMRYREALSNASCPNCGGPTAIGEMSFDEHHLRLENGRLREEVLQFCNFSKCEN
jgi:regulator of replication initiation timing